MAKTKLLIIYIFIICACARVVSCSDEDSFTTSPTARLTFSADSVKMDTVFSTIGSRTYDFWVYNRSTKGLRLSSVRLRQGNQTGFRVNVDGSYLDNTLGSVVTDLEVRSKDSIRVFVELTAPRNQQTEPQLVEDRLVFTLENGTEQAIVLQGHAWDADIYDSIIVKRDTVISTTRPQVILKGLRVDSGATLNINNTTLFFHNQAGIDIAGKLITDSVTMRGDRLDHMFDYLPYDRVSGQWRGLRFMTSSYGNTLRNTEIRNACEAIVCDSAEFSPTKQKLYMENCAVANSQGPCLAAYSSYVGLLRCLFANAEQECIAIYGGAAVIDHCTLAQFYPLLPGRGPALRFTNCVGDTPYPLHAMQMTNSIVTGYDEDVIMGGSLEGDSITPYSFHFENCLLRTPAIEDTINCKNIIWETPSDTIQGKAHFRLVDDRNMIYDFRLDSLSTAKGMGCYD